MIVLITDACSVMRLLGLGRPVLTMLEFQQNMD